MHFGAKEKWCVYKETFQKCSVYELLNSNCIGKTVKLKSEHKKYVSLECSENKLCITKKDDEFWDSCIKNMYFILFQTVPHTAGKLLC